ncbi:MAG: sugar phosphate isomerase/epimerase [Erysipelotrichaceae bacterium]|nr:sugar phosphate isomerase/epimerase [Erysipelotrichaceae bacterium]
MRIKLGIRGHDVPGAPFETIDEFVSSYKNFDLDYLQLVYKKAFRNFEMDPKFLLELSEKLKENDIRVAMIGAYFNMIHPDEEKRLNGIEYFKQCMETASVFGCDIVGSETGSANGDKWTYNDYNHTKEAHERVAETVKGLKYYGNSFRCRPVIEGAWAHTVYDPDQLADLIDETQIFDVTVDVYNYLNIENYRNADAIFDRCLDLFKDKIRIYHVKDFNVVDGKLVQCGIGQGIMNWQYFIPRIMKETPDAVLILEGVTGKDIQPSIEFIRRIEDGIKD